MERASRERTGGMRTGGTGPDPSAAERSKAPRASQEASEVRVRAEKTPAIPGGDAEPPPQNTHTRAHTRICICRRILGQAGTLSLRLLPPPSSSFSFSPTPNFRQRDRQH